VIKKELLLIILTLFLCSCSNNIEEENKIYKESKNDSVLVEEIEKKEDKIEKEDNISYIDKINDICLKHKNDKKTIQNILFIDDLFIVKYDNLKYLISNISNDKSIEIESLRDINKSNIKIIDNNMCICVNNNIKVIDILNLKMLSNTDYENIKDVQISDDMKNLTYTKEYKGIFYSDFLNQHIFELSLKNEIEGIKKFMLPRFLDNNNIVVEAIGNYPTGTNLIKYNLLDNRQEFLHITDHLVGHTSYLDNTINCIILYNEAEGYIVDANKLSLDKIIKFSEEKFVKPKFNNSKDAILYISDKNSVCVYNLLTKKEIVISENYDEGFLIWNYNDSKILRITEDKVFVIYEF